ncbi:MAG: hypothetical protein ACF8PN_08110 [Phycisphaerales bacterium]
MSDLSVNDAIKGDAEHVNIPKLDLWAANGYRQDDVYDALLAATGLPRGTHINDLLKAWGSTSPAEEAWETILATSTFALWAEDPALVTFGDGNPVRSAPGVGSTHLANRGITANGFENDYQQQTFAVTDLSDNLAAGQDLTLIMRVGLDDWTPTADRTFLAHSTGSIGPKFQLNTSTGELEIHASNGGNIAQSTVATGFTDGRANLYWIKVEYRASDDRVQFFTSSDDTDDYTAVTWSQLGGDVALVGGYGGGLTPWVVGGNNGSAVTQNTPLDGACRQVAVLDGLHSGGSATVRLAQSFVGQTPRASAVTDGTYPGAITRFDICYGQSGLFQFTAAAQLDWIEASPNLGDRPAFRSDGTDDYWPSPTNWPATISQPMWILEVCWSAATGGNKSLWDNLSGIDRIRSYRNNSDSTQNLWAGTAYGGFTDTNLHCTLWYLDGASTAYRDKDGNTGSPSADPGVNGLSGLTFAAFRGGGSGWAAEDFGIVAWIPGANLTQQEAFDMHDVWRSHYGAV